MNKDEFSRQILASEATLYHISRSILKNDSDCADAVQEAITTAFGNLHTLKAERYFKTWLCRILINECYRIARSRKKFLSIEDYIQPEKPSRPDTSDLSEAIMGLKEQLRLVIVLHYIDGFKTAEIASILKIPEGTVKSRLSRARLELKSILEQEEMAL